jgi:hypothetical protein
MKKLILLLFATCAFTFSHAQEEEKPPQPGEWKYFPFYHYVPNLGYAWQGINTFEAGLRLLPFTTNGTETFALISNAILFKHNDITYVSPEAMLRYNKPIKGIMRGYLAASFSCSYWTTKVLGEREHRITPEIGASIGIIGIYYGYNIPISQQELPFFLGHRIAVRLFTL